MQPDLLAIDDPRAVPVLLEQRLQRLGAQLAVFLLVRRVEQVVARSAGRIGRADEAGLLVYLLQVALAAGLGIEDVLGKFLKLRKLLAKIAIFAEQGIADVGVCERT